jgi:hypothetical protein
MKKVLLVSLILLDLVIMVPAAFFLYVHLSTHQNFTKLTPPTPTPVRTTNPIASSTHQETLINVSSGPAAAISTSTPPAAAEAGMRKILFSYRNPKAKQVFIRADFTGWKADMMHKDAKAMWVYQANLLPGEYAYCFTVDDKTFRDPANKRTKQIGRTFVSAIVVKPSAPASQ